MTYGKVVTIKIMMNTQAYACAKLGSTAGLKGAETVTVCKIANGRSPCEYIIRSE